MSLRTLALALALSSMAYPAANAADAGAAQPSDATGTTSTPINCGSMMPRHDHGAEKGTPTPSAAMNCPRGSGADKAAAGAPTNPQQRANARRGHDHARTHKLM